MDSTGLDLAEKVDARVGLDHSVDPRRHGLEENVGPDADDAQKKSGYESPGRSRRGGNDALGTGDGGEGPPQEREKVREAM